MSPCDTLAANVITSVGPDVTKDQFAVDGDGIRPSLGLGKNIVYDMSMNIGQPKFATLVAVGQPLVVES